MSDQSASGGEGARRGEASSSAAQRADESLTPRAAAAAATAAQAEIPPLSESIAQTRVWLTVNIDGASPHEIVILNNLEVIAAQNTQILAQLNHIGGKIKTQSRRSSMSDMSMSTSGVAADDGEDGDEAGGSQEEMVEQRDIQSKIQSMPHVEEMKQRYNDFVNEDGNRRRKYTTLTDRARADAAEFHDLLLSEVEDGTLKELLQRATIPTFQNIYKELGKTHPANLAKKLDQATKTKQKNKGRKKNDAEEDTAEPEIPDSDGEPISSRRGSKKRAQDKGKKVQTATESQQTIVEYDDPMEGGQVDDRAQVSDNEHDIE